MANPALSGPRRARLAPPQAPVLPAPTPSTRAIAVASSRLDDSGIRRTSVGARRGRWFALGLVVGAITAVIVRGEGPATLHDLRDWSARTLRSLEHRSERRPHSDLGVSAEAVASAPALTRSSHPSDAPCPVDPSPDDPCAELLAPFLKSSPTPDVPTVAFESLPRVKPPVVARRHHPVHAAPAPAAVASADADEDTADTTAKLEDMVAHAPVPIIAPEQTAENDVK